MQEIKLVLDANVLFSALIKEGIARELILADYILLYAPEFIVREFVKYIPFLEKKTKVGGSLLKSKVESLIRLGEVKLVSEEQVKDFIDKACGICPDEKDLLYFALALKLGCGIWSNDKKLKQQDLVKVYSTNDLIDFLVGSFD